MYRDFSNNSKIRMLGLVTEVENDKISDFTDWEEIDGMILSRG